MKFLRFATVLFTFVLLAGSVTTYAARARDIRIHVSNVQVSHDRYVAHSEPDVAENPTNHLNLIAGSKMFTNPAHYAFKIGMYYTLNGGRTWHDDGFLPGFKKYTLTSDISIAFDAEGNAYACVLAVKGKTSGIFVSQSTDGGVTWSTPVAVFLDHTGATFSDKPWIVVDQTATATNGNIYVAWNLDQGGSDADSHQGFLVPQAQVSPVTGMVVSRSVDHGRTWSAPAVIQPFTKIFPLGAIPAVGPDGTLYVAYASISDVSGQVTAMDLVTSHDGGLTFSPPQTVVPTVVGLPNHLKNSTFRNISMPAFAVSPSDGSLLLAWSDYRTGDADILASHSQDGGLTWSAPVRVNRDKVGNGKDQFEPALAVAPDGTFACSWFDRRADPHDRFINVDVADSVDDGASWSKNVRVTTRAWNPAIDAPEPEGKPSNTFIGDYQGLTADNQTIHPVWNDTQDGHSQEIRSATISFKVFRR